MVEFVKLLLRKESEVANVVDASDKIVAPGFIDLRAHLRELGGGGRETIASGTRAAAAGGFTTVVCMPDVSPAADNPGTIRYLQDAIEKDACIDVLLTGSITLDRKGRTTCAHRLSQAIGCGCRHRLSGQHGK